MSLSGYIDFMYPYLFLVLAVITLKEALCNKLVILIVVLFLSGVYFSAFRGY